MCIILNFHQKLISMTALTCPITFLKGELLDFSFFGEGPKEK